MEKDTYIGRQIGMYKIVGKQINELTREVEYTCKVGNVRFNFNKKKLKQLEKKYSPRD